jgi:phosphoribosylformylglycinamidine cyclo-ligase/phosphoribosylamine--glycine ligase/phosphoribosylformylglycinamidine cyclo-ligase
VVERKNILPKNNLKAGDVLVGLRSSGPHTNGYSLIRKVFGGIPLTSMLDGLGIPLGDALLEPHRSYLPLLKGVLTKPDHPVKGLIHITGGGFIENIPRILPDNLAAVIMTSTWQVPRLYQIIQQRGAISTQEMYRIFNMGIGMIAVVSPERASELQQSLGEESWVIGQLVTGARQVILQ